MKNLLVLTTLALLILNSCTIQKRNYNKGFSVNWHNSTGLKIEKKAAKTKKTNSFQTTKNDSLLITEETSNHVNQSSPSIETDTSETAKCDLIILKNGEEIWANVLEIDPENIKYKRCDNPEGPTYFIRRSTVFMIKYKNGSKDVFRDAPPTTEYIEPVQNTPTEAKNEETQTTSNEENSAFFGIASIVLTIIALFTPISLGLMLLVVAFLFGIAGAFGKNAAPAIIGMILSLLLILVFLASMS